MQIHTPKGRQPWLIPEASSAGGLRYLAWGRRRYGDSPVPIAKQTGYVYFFIRKGSPNLRLASESRPCPQGTFFIAHPDCSLGWGAPAGSEHEILCWIWENPPLPPLLAPCAAGIKFWSFAHTGFPFLMALHQKTRRELAIIDEFTADALRLTRQELDITLARHLRPSERDSPLPDRLATALNWMRQKPNSTRPVADLCDLLGCSPTTLTRLFKKHLSQSPLDYYNKLKAQLATRQLQQGQPIKTIAYDLGYRYSHDFSRFYRQQTGQPPSAVSQKNFHS